MAKSTMGRARFKIQRRLGLELPGLGKPGALDRRPYPPGQHGMKRKKLSDYTIRLMEKQKIIFHYGLREKQLRRYVRNAKKSRGQAWADSLIITLESRLDNVIFRLNFAPSMMAARQLVSHGHVKINGKRVYLAGITVKKGDKIVLTQAGYQTGCYLQGKDKPRMVTPAYLRKDLESGLEVGQMLAAPDAKDIPFAFNTQLITEYYWKV